MYEARVLGLKVDGSSSMGGARWHVFDFHYFFVYRCIHLLFSAIREAGGAWTRSLWEGAPKAFREARGH